MTKRPENKHERIVLEKKFNEKRKRAPSKIRKALLTEIKLKETEDDLRTFV